MILELLDKDKYKRNMFNIFKDIKEYMKEVNEKEF